MGPHDPGGYGRTGGGLSSSGFDTSHNRSMPSALVNNVKDGMDFSGKIGFPVIIRPSFTLGGSGGGLAYNREELIEILEDMGYPKGDPKREAETEQLVSEVDEGMEKEKANKPLVCEVCGKPNRAFLNAGPVECEECGAMLDELPARE